MSLDQETKSWGRKRKKRKTAIPETQRKECLNDSVLSL